MWVQMSCLFIQYVDDPFSANYAINRSQSFKERWGGGYLVSIRPKVNNVSFVQMCVLFDELIEASPTTNTLKLC